MNGLKPKIQAGVKNFEPRTSEKMMSVAKRVEDWKFQGVLTTEMDSRVPASNLERLELVTAMTSLYGVLVAGGVSVKGRCMIHNVELEMHDCTIVTSFLSLELGIADVILDVQWLDTLGEMHVNWKLQVMN